MRRNPRIRNKLSKEPTTLTVADLEVIIEKTVRQIVRQEIDNYNKLRLFMENSQPDTNQPASLLTVADLEALLTKVVRQVIKEERMILPIQQLQTEETSTQHPLEKFMETFGAWEDDRTDEEIIKDIYDSRSFSNS